jgi:hypothetical protein
MHNLAQIGMRSRRVGLKLHQNFAVNLIHALNMRYFEFQRKNTAYRAGPGLQFAQTLRRNRV